MPVHIRDNTGVRVLTMEAARIWLGYAAAELFNDHSSQQAIAACLAGSDHTFDNSEAHLCLSWVKDYVDQLELLRGFVDIGTQIMAAYPVQNYLYVGVGRSPSAVMAWLENQRVRTVGIPLSDFRPRQVEWSITDAALAPPIAPQPRITPEQQQQLFAHFRRYFPERPARPCILLIDFTITAQSLIAAQEQLQGFFQSHGMEDVEVHALAICRDSDAPTVEGLRSLIGTPRSMWSNPIDWMFYSGQRQTFAERWHVLPICPFLTLPTRRQQLVMATLRHEGLDGVAQYGSFKILTHGAVPRHFIGDPENPAAYDVLREELRHL
jgi:hypothetical protein